MSFFNRNMNKKESKPKKKPYHPEDYIASHGQVLKHVFLINLLLEYTKENNNNNNNSKKTAKGIRFVDCIVGDGVHDLNQHSNPLAYTQYGIITILQQIEQDPDNTPDAILQYIQCIKTITGCTSSNDLDVYPESPVIVQHILSSSSTQQELPNEHRLIRKKQQQHSGDVASTEEIQWFDPTKPNTMLLQNDDVDVYDIENSIEFILPYIDENDTLHPIVYIDPDYIQDCDYMNTKQLVTTILQQCSYTTIIVTVPVLHNHPYRYTYIQSIKDIAKQYATNGRFYCQTILCPTTNASSNNSHKEHTYIGDAILIINPPIANIDTIFDDHCIHWMANVLNQGKDEYTIEHIVKKKKK